MKEKQQQPVVSVENCPHCFDNAQKHLIVSLGKHAYMSVPSSESLIDGHCFIVPMSHQSSSVTCDEEVWNEIQDFKKGLIKMFQAKNKDSLKKKHFFIQILLFIIVVYLESDIGE